MKKPWFFSVLLTLVITAALAKGMSAQASPPLFDEQSQVSMIDGLPFRAEWLTDGVEGLFGAKGSLALSQDDAGNPFIAFVKHTSNDIHYTLYFAEPVGSGGNCTADGRWKCTQVAVSTDAIMSLSIDYYTSTQPDTIKIYGIAYYNKDDHTIRYARKSCVSSGECVWNEENAVSSPHAGYNGLSLQFDKDGNPQIFYTTYYPGLLSTSVRLATKITNSWSNVELDWGSSSTYSYFAPILEIDSSGRWGAAVRNASGAITYIRPAPGGPGTGTCTNTNYTCYDLEPSGKSQAQISITWADSEVYAPQIAYVKEEQGYAYLHYAYMVQDPTDTSANCGQERGAGSSSYKWNCSEIFTVGAAPTNASYIPINGVALAIDVQGDPVIAYQRTNVEAKGLFLAYPALSGNCGPQVSSLSASESS
ncbi:MAG TPA: hypothetical protein VHO48_09685, partial [Anaerolineaceae bacterium]|nr:hypothetical protein [Anaerolineaceae bacterium]